MKNTGGSGGLIASFGNGIVSDNTWKCTTRGMRNWQTASFDDSNWPAAVVHDSNSGNVRVNGISPNAKWIGTSQRNANGFYCRRRMTLFGDTPMIGGSKKETLFCLYL